MIETPKAEGAQLSEGAAGAAATVAEPEPSRSGCAEKRTANLKAKGIAGTEHVGKARTTKHCL